MFLPVLIFHNQLVLLYGYLLLNSFLLDGYSILHPLYILLNSLCFTAISYSTISCCADFSFWNRPCCTGISYWNRSCFTKFVYWSRACSTVIIYIYIYIYLFTRPFRAGGRGQTSTWTNPGRSVGRWIRPAASRKVDFPITLLRVLWHFCANGAPSGAGRRAHHDRRERALWVNRC